MISFFAYHGDAARKEAVIARINALRETGVPLSLISALAGGPENLSVAHHECGFTVALLRVSEGIFAGLAPDEAPAFLLDLALAARIDASIGDVADDFLQWMFTEAVAEFGLARLRASAGGAGPVFSHLAQNDPPGPAHLKLARALARKARRRGTRLPGPDQAFAARAAAAALEQSGNRAGEGVRWIAQLADDPAAQFRRFAARLLALVAAA